MNVDKGGVWYGIDTYCIYMSAFKIVLPVIIIIGLHHAQSHLLRILLADTQTSPYVKTVLKRPILLPLTVDPKHNNM